jgi:hypothetical protein
MDTPPAYHAIIRHLAEGVHPLTGEILSQDTILNDPTVIRALFSVLTDAEAAQKRQATKRSMPENFGKPWDEAGRTRVREAFLAGETEASLARELKRTRGAITAELTRQGLISPSSYKGVREPNQSLYDATVATETALTN